MAKAKTPKEEQTEIPMEGPGVAAIKDKKLDNLCDKFIDIRDQKAELATELGDLDSKIRDRMQELGIRRHRFADQICEIKEGKDHVKIKTVKADGDDDGSEPGDDPGT